MDPPPFQKRALKTWLDSSCFYCWEHLKGTSQKLQGQHLNVPNFIFIPSPKPTVRPLKISAWKMNFVLGQKAYFQRLLLLVSGRVLYFFLSKTGVAGFPHLSIKSMRRAKSRRITRKTPAKTNRNRLDRGSKNGWGFPSLGKISWTPRGATIFKVSGGRITKHFRLKWRNPHLFLAVCKAYVRENPPLKKSLIRFSICICGHNNLEFLWKASKRQRSSLRSFFGDRDGDIDSIYIVT